jgi:hypothetical protein
LADATVESNYDYLIHEWNDIDVRANLNPFPWVSVTHLNTLSRTSARPYATSVHSTRGTFTDTHGDSLSFGEEYHRPDTKLITSGIKVTPVQGLIAGYDVKYDFIAHQVYSQDQSFSYLSQCWAVQVERRQTAAQILAPGKTTWSLNVKLLGMGDILRPSSSMHGASSK